MLAGTKGAKPFVGKNPVPLVKQVMAKFDHHFFAEGQVVQPSTKCRVLLWGGMDKKIKQVSSRGLASAVQLDAILGSLRRDVLLEPQSPLVQDKRFINADLYLGPIDTFAILSDSRKDRILCSGSSAAS